MKNNEPIPTQFDNPTGLHQRYYIQKIVKRTVPGKPAGIGLYGKRKEETEEEALVIVPCDKDAEYFVLRVDKGGKDLNHVNACRIGLRAYADAIEPFIPELAKDIRTRYPVSPLDKDLKRHINDIAKTDKFKID